MCHFVPELQPPPERSNGNAKTGRQKKKKAKCMFGPDSRPHASGCIYNELLEHVVSFLHTQPHTLLLYIQQATASKRPSTAGLRRRGAEDPENHSPSSLPSCIAPLHSGRGLLYWEISFAHLCSSTADEGKKPSNNQPTRNKRLRQPWWFAVAIFRSRSRYVLLVLGSRAFPLRHLIPAGSFVFPAGTRETWDREAQEMHHSGPRRGGSSPETPGQCCSPRPWKP